MELSNGTAVEAATIPAGESGVPALTRASGLFGEIVRLLMQSPAHKHVFLADLEWLLLPPFRHKQFRVIYDDKAAIGAALWASVSDKVDKELSAGRTRLKPEEWKSGDRLWLIDLVAPSVAGKPKAHQAMLSELSRSAFSGQPFKFHRVDPKTGKPQAVTVNLRGKTAAEAPAKA